MSEKTSAKATSESEQEASPRRAAGGRSLRRKGVDRQEIEWRFEAPDLAAVEAWLAAPGLALSNGVSVSEERGTKQLSDSYFDTADWRVYRGGYALRARQGDGDGVEVTLKSLASEGGGSGETKRREVVEIHKGADPGAAVEALRGSKGPAGEVFRPFVGAREMRLVFALRTRRRTFDLVLDEAREGTGELVVDASGNILERGGDGPATTDSGAEVEGIAVDAAGDIREDDAESTVENGGGAPADGDGEIVADASGNIRRRKPSDETPSDGAGSGAGDRVVGEVVLDETEIFLGEGEEPTRLSRVEVEAGADETGDTLQKIGTFVEEMREALGLKPARLSKYAAGLFATGQSPEAASDLGPTRIDDSLTLGELAFAVLRRQFGKMRSCEQGVRIGEDPEEVHDMRVATRRMRAAIKLFKKALPERAQHLRDELKWVANSLGGVRDLDVQLERLEGWASEAEDDAYRDALRKTIRAVEKEREGERGTMLEAIDSARYERFERSFAEMLKLGPTSSLALGAEDGESLTDEPAAAAGQKLLSRRYRKWRKLSDGLDESSVPEDYHDLRKEGKRLRYALEFFSEVYGDDVVGELVGNLKTVQDDLGLHQDDMFAAEWLRELVTGGRRFPSRAAFYVGMLVGGCLREAAGIRDGLSENKAYRAVAKGKKWKKLKKKISKIGA